MLPAAVTLRVLLNLYYNLREHNFSLGVGEFILALKALAYGFGSASRDDFFFVCQTLWAKSLVEQHELAKLLDVIWSKTAAEEKEEISVEKKSDASTPIKSKEAFDSTSQPVPLPNQDRFDVPLFPLLQFTSGPGTAGGKTIPKIRQAQLNPSLDLVGSLPIRGRHMKRAWRYYRKMCRIGSVMEIDLSATVDQFARHGLLLYPEMVPCRTNQARILFLVDEGGSMVPFRRMVRMLIASVKQGGLSQYMTYYFHDVPKQNLFKDPALNHSVPIWDILGKAASAGALIISDGGAARGGMDEWRVQKTGEFIQALQRVIPYFAWLNPTPQERWEGTTAGSIRSKFRIDMFTFDRDGLDNAVDILRGKVS